MTTLSMDIAAGSFVAGPLVIGIALVVGLGYVAVYYGRIRRRREPPPQPRPPASQPRSGAWQTPAESGGEVPPDHGPGHQNGEPVEYEEGTSPPEEVPHDGRRRLPYEIRDSYPGPKD